MRRTPSPIRVRNINQNGDTFDASEYVVHYQGNEALYSLIKRIEKEVSRHEQDRTV